MYSDTPIRIVQCHAAGEVGDVVVGGAPLPPGDTVWDQSRFIAKDRTLRQYLLNEPRGGIFRHANLLVPPRNPDAQAAFIIMEPSDTPPMSGSNAMCVAKVLIDTGLIEARSPETRFVLEAPGGIITVTAKCQNGKAGDIRIENLPSFADQLDRKIEVDGFGTLTVDTAFGGDSFVVVSTAETGIAIEPSNAKKLTSLGMNITKAANEQIGFAHPTIDGMNEISFCLFADPVSMSGDVRKTRHAVVIRPGRIDRSPTGTGVSARLALLHEREKINVGDELEAQSIIGSWFRGRVEYEMTLADRAAIRPSVTGRAYIFGTSTLQTDPQDPWCLGYRLNDTWPEL